MSADLRLAGNVVDDDVRYRTVIIIIDEIIVNNKIY